MFWAIVAYPEAAVRTPAVGERRTTPNRVPLDTTLQPLPCRHPAGSPFEPGDRPQQPEGEVMRSFGRDPTAYPTASVLVNHWR